jgi:FixJ family two-component response regulator
MPVDHREIAVVEDDRGAREALLFLLAATGHQAVGYGSADEFLQRGGLDQVSGLILDHHMPRTTGLELAARLRADGWHSPILLITGAPSPAIIARAADLGIEKVPEKPPAEADIRPSLTISVIKSNGPARPYRVPFAISAWLRSKIHFRLA